MNALARLRLPAVVVVVVGLAVLAIGIALYIGAPAKPSSDAFLSGRASIDEVGAHNEAVFRAFAVGAIGVFIAFAGAGLLILSSRTLHRAGAELIETSAASIARGLDQGRGGRDIGARLAQLDALRRDGHITAAEYESKRREVLADV